MVNTIQKLENRSYFFDQGLRFECQRCGVCCTGGPGTVYVDKAEIARIANYLKLPTVEFIDQYLYPYRDSYSIKEDEFGNCLFYQSGCHIYSTRPLQCRTFPFWFENLRSKENWRRLGRECPGVDRGRLYSKEKILKIVQSTFHLVYLDPNES
ncbi:MAG: YkgJ family cysteine cluster protein [Desulfobacterales bacterium]|nr:YkgJ family cysteine cluster protein [Desulfobacterales bacterium]